MVLKIVRPWTIGSKTIASGSVVAIDKSALMDGAVKSREVKILFVPDEKSSVFNVEISKNKILINVLFNVSGRIFVVGSTLEQGTPFRIGKCL